MSGYCCDEGEEAGGGLGPLRVYEEKVVVVVVVVGGGCEGGKPMSGTILVNGRRSVRLEKSGAEETGFLGNWKGSGRRKSTIVIAIKR